MTGDAHDTLAGVYDWLVPDALLTPEGSVQALESVVAELAPGASVLDCAAGTGQLAVGLALRGLAVVASDASGEMVLRTQRLAPERRVQIETSVCTWEQLGGGPFDAVFCVGNSLTRTAGRTARRAALAAMARVLRDGGLLVLTSRNWELVLGAGSRLDIAEQLVERDGRQALVVHAWTIAQDSGEPHHLDVAVAILGEGGGVTTHRERLPFWSFTHDELDDDLRAAGLAPLASTYADDIGRYLVTESRLRPEAGLD